MPRRDKTAAGKFARWLLLAPAALLLLAGFVISRGPAALPPGSPGLAAPAAPTGPLKPASLAGGIAPVAPTGADLERVRREVADRNHSGQDEKKRFVSAGWTLVDAPPPEARLLSYDPALLGGREPELRTQIASTVAAPAQVGNLGEVARRASDESTRVAAVEALGRVGGREAQAALLSLLDEGLPQDDAARRQIVPLLRPTDLDDPLAAELARRIDSPQLSRVERKQLAFTLALLGLRDGTTLPRAALSALSPQARALLDSMTTLARTAGQQSSKENP